MQAFVPNHEAKIPTEVYIPGSAQHHTIILHINKKHTKDFHWVFQALCFTAHRFAPQ